MDGANIIGSLISGGILLALGGMIAALFKVNTNLARLNAQHDNLKERLDRLEGSKGCASSALLGLLMLLAVFVSGCSLLGLDMEQAQADAEETASALEIVANQADAVAQEIVRLEEVWKNAESSNDIERMREVWPQLQSAYQLAKLKKVELKEIQVVFNNRVEQFKEAKDTKGYLQAALGLLGGVAAVFFPGLAAIKRRNKLIDVALPKKSGDALSNRQQALLDKIRKA